MKQKITKETPIDEALKINPKAAEILMESGLGCVGCMFKTSENLYQGLITHGYSTEEIEEIMELLNE